LLGEETASWERNKLSEKLHQQLSDGKIT